MEIKIEHEMWGERLNWARFVIITMTNNKGTQYVTHVFKGDFESDKGAYPSRVMNVINGVSIRTRNAPKWVRDTIEQQLPVIKIMFSCDSYE